MSPCIQLCVYIVFAFGILLDCNGLRDVTSIATFFVHVTVNCIWQTPARHWSACEWHRGGRVARCLMKSDTVEHYGRVDARESFVYAKCVVQLWHYPLGWEPVSKWKQQRGNFLFNLLEENKSEACALCWATWKAGGWGSKTSSQITLIEI